MSDVVQEVEQLYRWLDTANRASSGLCKACGDCCDFDTFGHKLFITTAELIYLADKLGKENMRKMTAGRCPWQLDDKCGIHPHRFAGCRVFFCKGNTTTQNDLGELSTKKLKTICTECGIPYRYMDLHTALDETPALLH